jgi:hypothetical protein
MIITYIPKELVDIILDYDGRLKYKKGKYVDIIHKHDIRYNIIKPVISKKIEIMNEITFANDYNSSYTKDSYYFEFGFDINNGIGLCYDYNFSYTNKFEICYYDFRNTNDIKQIRTYL